jgi:uncharacterized protein
LGVKQEAESRERNACFQKRIDGVPCAAVFVAADGAAQLLGVSRQLVGEAWLGANEFQYAGSIGPWPVAAATQATLTRLGNVLAERFELMGLFGVDFILDGDQVWPVEVNPRYTASVEVIERFSGVSAIAAHAAACGGVTNEARRAGSPAFPIGAEDGPGGATIRACGKAILYARHEIVISEAFADLALAEALRTPWPTLADIPTGGEFIESGRPILTVFADGERLEAVERQLQERVAELERLVYS